MDWSGWPYWEYKQIKHITFTVSLISGGARVSSRDSVGKMLLIRQFLTDMFVYTSVSEEKECSELPEQPAAPGNQEERSVWNTDPQVKDQQLLPVDQTRVETGDSKRRRERYMRIESGRDTVEPLYRKVKMRQVQCNRKERKGAVLLRLVSIQYSRYSRYTVELETNMLFSTNNML